MSLFWRMADYPQHNNRSFKNQRAVRKGSWKYIWDGNVEQLFDLAHDPGERHDLQNQHQKLLFEMRELYAQWEKDVTNASLIPNIGRRARRSQPLGAFANQARWWIFNPNFLIRLRSVEGGRSRIAAAPCGPETRPRV